MNFKLTILISISSCLICISQIQVDCNPPYDNATQLVNLLVNGVPFSNATLSSGACGAGYFDDTNSNIDLSSGLVMATGGLESLIPGTFGGGIGGVGSDPDLTLQLDLVGSTSTNLNNLVILEFDFVPNSDQISFQYVFASNEYPGYTCSNFNDIFGFFLSGPGINGPFTNNAINIALVPDPNNPDNFTNTPVTINSINSGVASGLSSDACESIDPNWESYSIFFTDNNAQEYVNMPGFTVPLVATASVIPCETYHIKLAIADVSDGALNSAVFLLENSFSSVGVSIDSDSEYGPYIGNDTTLVEGCFSGELIFELNQPINTNYIIDFSVGGSADDGIDYEQIGNQAVITAGQTYTSIPIIPFYDGIFEGNEDIIVSATISDGCNEEDVDYIFNIVDRLELFLEMPLDTSFCPDDPEIILSPNLSGGIYPLSYQWFYNGLLYSNQEQISVTPENLGTYSFIATDLCDSQVNGQLSTFLLEPEEPLSIFSSYTNIESCLNDDFSTDILVNGGVGTPNITWYLNGNLYSDSMNFNIPTDIPYEFNFELIVNDECSNIVSEIYNINIMDCFVPNVFTPNNDGENDYFYINFGDIVNNVRVRIYNRWGEVVYSGVHYELCDEKSGEYCWDGIHMSEKDICPEGTYFYTVEYLDGREYKGYVHLFR